MESEQLPIFPTLPPATAKAATTKSACQFAGTANPRGLRVLHALLMRVRLREEIDRIAGASNGPDLICQLRRLGLTIPCVRTPSIDRDGGLVQVGVYSLDRDDRRKVGAWLRKLDTKGKA
jgi:hypothetical protein